MTGLSAAAFVEYGVTLRRWPFWPERVRAGRDRIRRRVQEHHRKSVVVARGRFPGAKHAHVDDVYLQRVRQACSSVGVDEVVEPVFETRRCSVKGKEVGPLTVRTSVPPHAVTRAMAMVSARTAPPRRPGDSRRVAGARQSPDWSGSSEGSHTADRSGALATAVPGRPGSRRRPSPWPGLAPPRRRAHPARRRRPLGPWRRPCLP